MYRLMFTLLSYRTSFLFRAMESRRTMDRANHSVAYIDSVLTVSIYTRLSTSALFVNDETNSLSVTFCSISMFIFTWLTLVFILSIYIYSSTNLRPILIQHPNHAYDSKAQIPDPSSFFRHLQILPTTPPLPFLQSTLSPSASPLVPFPVPV